MPTFGALREAQLSSARLSSRPLAPVGRPESGSGFEMVARKEKVLAFFQQTTKNGNVDELAGAAPNESENQLRTQMSELRRITSRGEARKGSSEGKLEKKGADLGKYLHVDHTA